MQDKAHTFPEKSRFQPQNRYNFSRHEIFLCLGKLLPRISSLPLCYPSLYPYPLYTHFVMLILWFLNQRSWSTSPIPSLYSPCRQYTCTSFPFSRHDVHSCVWSHWSKHQRCSLRESLSLVQVRQLYPHRISYEKQSTLSLYMYVNVGKKTIVNDLLDAQPEIG